MMTAKYNTCAKACQRLSYKNIDR